MGGFAAAGPGRRKPRRPSAGGVSREEWHDEGGSLRPRSWKRGCPARWGGRREGERGGEAGPGRGGGGARRGGGAPRGGGRAELREGRCHCSGRRFPAVGYIARSVELPQSRLGTLRRCGAPCPSDSGASAGQGTRVALAARAVGSPRVRPASRPFPALPAPSRNLSQVDNSRVPTHPLGAPLS